MKKILGCGLLVIFILCALFTAAAGIESKIIKIGVYLPISGSTDTYGQAIYQGIKVAHKMRPWVLGKNVEIVLADTKSDITETARAVDRLIKKNKVQALIGEATNANTIAGAAIADAAGIPMVTPTATSPRVIDDRRSVFRVCFTDTFQGEAAAHYAYDTIKARKAAVMIDIAQDYSIGLATAFERTFMRKGGKIVAHTYCQTMDQDFTLQLSEIVAAKPDVLYLPNYYREVALVCKQLAVLGLNTIIIAAESSQTKELLEIGGKDVEQVIFTNHFAIEAATTHGAQEYLTKYQAETGQDAGAYEVLGADAYFVILNAVERAKSLGAPSIRRSLSNTRNFKGVSGIINIGSDGNAVRSLVFMHVKNGAFSYLATYNP
jgi:branched-chain amino acid transport system substrate-binding protein